MWPFRRSSLRKKRSKSAERIRKKRESRSRISRDQSKSSKRRHSLRRQQQKQNKQFDEDGVTEFEEVNIVRKPARTKLRKATLKWKKGVQRSKSAEPKTPPPATGSLMLSVPATSLMSTVTEKSTMVSSMGKDLPESETQSDHSEIVDDVEKQKKEMKNGKSIKRGRKTGRMKEKSLRRKKMQKDAGNYEKAVPPKSTLLDIQPQGELKSMALKPNVELSKSIPAETLLSSGSPELTISATTSSFGVTIKSSVNETNAPNLILPKILPEALKNSEMETLSSKQGTESNLKLTEIPQSSSLKSSTGSSSMEMRAITIPSERSVTALKPLCESFKLPYETSKPTQSSMLVNKTSKITTETSKEVVNLSKVVPEKKSELSKGSLVVLKKSTLESPQTLPETETHSLKSLAKPPQLGSSIMGMVDGKQTVTNKSPAVEQKDLNVGGDIDAHKLHPRKTETSDGEEEKESEDESGTSEEEQK